MICSHLFKNILDRIANTYSKTAWLPNEIAHRLLAHLDAIPFQPKTVVDLGCRTGYTAQLLKTRFPAADIIALELSEAMLNNIALEINAQTIHNYAILPLTAHSVDLVFSNLALSWCAKRIKNFQEIHRILKPEGLFLFSLFGMDTLKEAQQSWQNIDAFPHIHLFDDMHIIGDLLLQQQFVNPVMATEHLIVFYSSVEKLCRELKASGLQNLHADRYRYLTGKKRWQQFTDNYQLLKKSQGLPATFEIIYGQAHTGKQLTENAEVYIPLSAIKRSQP